jgi:RNA polymerase sigma-70 factor (ECF subfamily)
VPDSEPLPSHFPTTLWWQINKARQGSRTEMDLLLSRYRNPILAFIRRKGHPPEEAEDIVQEVLMRISQPGFLERADASKGRFRSLLFAVTKYVMSEYRRWHEAQKRGGGAAVVNTREMSMTDTNVFDRVAEESDPVFDQLWVAEIVEKALKDLDAESPQRAQAFRLKYLEGLSQEEVAKRLGVSVFDAKNHIYYGKLKFKALVLTAIKAYCSTPEEYEVEVKRLSPYLKGKGE